MRFVVSGPAYRVCGSCPPYYEGQQTSTSGSVVANRCRTDVQQAHGLSYCDVGYSWSFLTTWMWGAGTTVCAQARDHGTTQAWRGVGCRTAQVSWA